MKNIRLVVILLFIIVLTFVGGAHSETFIIDKAVIPTDIYPIGLVFRYSEGSCDFLTEVEQYEDSSPTVIQNGDVLYFMAFANSEVMNYNEESLFGIESFSLRIQKVDTCGSYVIKNMTDSLIEFYEPFCFYKVEGFEDGLYKAIIEIKSSISDLSTTTWESVDNGGYKEFFFKVGEAPDIEAHKEYTYKLLIKDDIYPDGERLFKGSSRYNYSFLLYDTSIVYFNRIDDELLDKVKGIEIYVYDLLKCFYFDIDDPVCFSALYDKSAYSFSVRYVYKDGCYGPVSNVFINVATHKN